MAKIEFSDILEKTKETASSVGSKISKTATQIKETAKDKYEDIKEKSNARKNDKHDSEDNVRIKLDDALRLSVTHYNDAFTIMNDNGDALCDMRTRAVDLILNVETLVNSIANRPKSFDTDIVEIQSQRMSFTDACEFAKAELDAAKKSALGAGAGIATGAAIVSVAPAAAMWVATTFGTASTGTAISALSGAAAQSAALAWLGGGAVAAGGGGMAAGHAFLALAGPIGWAVAGATLLTSITLFSVKKIKLDKQKKEQIEAIKRNTETTWEIAGKIQLLIDEVTLLRDQLNNLYANCLYDFGKDFSSIPEERQLQLGALVNNTKALAASLGKSID